jgi:hypothetical protein
MCEKGRAPWERTGMMEKPGKRRWGHRTQGRRSQCGKGLPHGLLGGPGLTSQ